MNSAAVPTSNNRRLSQTVYHPLTPTRSDHTRIYLQYAHQPTPTSTGHLSDGTDDSGICLEQSGGPTPPSTVNFDRISNCSGSSAHLDAPSKRPTDPLYTPHFGEGSLYQSGEVYSSLHVTVPAMSTASPAVAGLTCSAPTACSPLWIGGRSVGKTTEALTSAAGDVWLKSSPMGGRMALGGLPLVGRKQLLYGMFSRYEDGTRWQCEECKKLFSSQGSLRAHARIHTGERPYQCQYCCRTFCQASTLRSHERLHTGEKPYKCEHCGRAFTQSAGLRSHLKTHRYDA